MLNVRFQPFHLEDRQALFRLFQDPAFQSLLLYLRGQVLFRQAKASNSAIGATADVLASHMLPGGAWEDLMQAKLYHATVEILERTMKMNENGWTFPVVDNP